MSRWSQVWSGIKRRASLRRRRQQIGSRLEHLVPCPVRQILANLLCHHHSAHLVGGCVRDLFLEREPGDWDVATSALPREVQGIFRRTHPTGIKHGTVTVMSNGMAVEVTTYRLETDYADFRHPSGVVFTGDVQQDLARRDFTFNAMAMTPAGVLVDPFGGLHDLSSGVVRAVGDPDRRFSEDALRLVRAVRFAAQLGFDLEHDTRQALGRNAGLLEHISKERIRDELVKILLSDAPSDGVRDLSDLGLLGSFWPELEDGRGFEQNPHHAYCVLEHSIRALGETPPDLALRLAALLHDVAKPRCMTADEDGSRRFFHHEQVGARIARKMLYRLRFDRDTIQRVCHLIRYHMALHHYPDMTDAAIRRLIRRVGPDSIDDLVLLRRADRLASGTKKGPLSRGAKRLLRRIDQVMAEDAAFSIRDLAVDGRDVMSIGGLSPGPRVGQILDQLLEMVLEEPELNTRQRLEAEILNLSQSDAREEVAADEPKET